VEPDPSGFIKKHDPKHKWKLTRPSCDPFPQPGMTDSALSESDSGRARGEGAGDRDEGGGGRRFIAGGGDGVRV
jgi:hypothetical protein